MSDSPPSIPTMIPRYLAASPRSRFLPHEHRTGLLLRPDCVQPARYRPLGPQFQVCRLPRLVGWRPPATFTPKRKPYVEFESSEEINNYLLRDPEVQAFIASRGGRPKVAMLFFDEETERICAELGYELILPSDALAGAWTPRS